MMTARSARCWCVGRGILGPGVALLHKPFTGAALASKVREVLDAKAKS